MTRTFYNTMLDPQRRAKRVKRRVWFALGALLFTGALVSAIVVSCMSPLGASSCDVDGGAFTPDMTYGNLTLTEARAIDISWNLFIGRGTQALVGYTTYRITANALLRVAEMVPISYDTFAAMGLNNPTSTTLLPLLNATYNTPGWRPKAIFAWLFFCALVALALPTLLDISTGYLQAQRGYVSWPNGTMTDFDEAYGSAMATYAFSDGSNQTINERLTYIRKNRICVPSAGYEWGYNFSWGCAVVSLLSVWAWGCYGIWVDSTRFSILVRHSRHMGQWRAIADIADAMREHLGPHLRSLSDSELRKRLKKAPPIKYSLADELKWGTQHVQLSSRAATASEVDRGYGVKGVD